LDTATLHDVETSARRLAQAVDRLQRRLPQPGQPPEVYALQARIGSDDQKAASVRLADGGTAWVVWIETTVDAARLHDEVLRPLQETALRGQPPPGAAGHPLLPRAKPVESLDDQAQALLGGWAVVFAHGAAAAVEVERFPTRTVDEPSTEQAVLGPKEAFTEHVQTNVGAVRHRIRDEHLRVERFSVGRRSRTQVALIYLGDVANPDLVESTRRGLMAIDTDFVRTSNEIAEFLYQRSLTTVPLTEQTERPDRAASAIAAGRLCLIVDGTPFVLLVPTTLAETTKDGETSLPGPINAGFVRCLRLLGEIISVSAGGLYVAVMTAETPLLPTPIALAVSASRNGVPYPVLTETLIMLLIIDVFSEATAQAPGGIGNTLSIVGTLIIGQMAVQARLASSLMMIVVASTALGSFLTLKFPYSYTLRLWKYPIALLSGVAGLFGWMAGMLLMLTHMASLKSAGVPYLSPLGPLNQRSLWQTGVTKVPGAYRKRRPGQWDVQDIEMAGGGRP
jgi:hypothetical protein